MHLFGKYICLCSLYTIILSGQRYFELLCTHGVYVCVSSGRWSASTGQTHRTLGRLCTQMTQPAGPMKSDRVAGQYVQMY